MSLPCRRKENGYQRLRPLNEMFCDNNNINDEEDCVIDRWNRKDEVFFFPDIHYSVIQSINKI